MLLLLAAGGWFLQRLQPSFLPKDLSTLFYINLWLTPRAIFGRYLKPVRWEASEEGRRAITEMAAGGNGRAFAVACVLK